MKIGILTWSKVVNHGAVLQAYATREVLKKMGCTPVMLDYQANRQGQQTKLGYKLRHIGNKLTFHAIKVRKMFTQWMSDKQEEFDAFRYSELSLGDFYYVDQQLDATIIGSDMVFDFFEGYNPFMYGKDVLSPIIFSYAACFGYTTEKSFDSFSQKGEICTYLKKMDGISYRDDNTGKILKNCCGINNAVKVIDPVLLYGFKNEYTTWDSFKWKQRKYVLIYAYTYNMDKSKEVQAICSFAKERELEIISVGYIHSWCDESINAGPKEFVELFKYAQYVFTDTFHGTVFSLTFEKQFCTIVRNNAFKLQDLMDMLGLANRLNASISKEITMLITQPIDYTKVNTCLYHLRQKSLKYICDQLKKVE